LIGDDCDHGKSADDVRGAQEPRGRTEESEECGAPGDHQGDRGGARDDVLDLGIAEVEDIISRAEVIDFSKLSGKTVKFGATVKLADEDTDEKVKYQIVGPYEADLAKGRISVTSPIGRALIGKTVGDTVEVQTPRGARSYEVVGVAFK
jgi:transcription elongation factor GreA